MAVDEIYSNDLETKCKKDAKISPYRRGNMPDKMASSLSYLLNIKKQKLRPPSFD